MVESFGDPVAYDPLRGGVGLLDRHRVLGFRGSVVLDEHHCGVHTHRQLAYQPVMGAGVAEHPPAAVHVQHRRHAQPGGTDRLDDPDLHVTDRCRHRDPLLVDLRFVDRCSLDVVEHLAGTVGAEVVEERRLRRRVGDLLGGRLQDVVVHGGSSFEGSVRSPCRRRAPLGLDGLAERMLRSATAKTGQTCDL